MSIFDSTIGPASAAEQAVQKMVPFEIRAIQIWLACLGLSLSISLAVSNILVAAMLLYLFTRHMDQVKKQFHSKLFVILISAACIFQTIGIIHDGWMVTKALKIYLLFSTTLLIGNVLTTLNVRWLPWLLSGLFIGLVAGTALNLYFRPEYPMWATYAMSYANQAAGFALTIGLLSYASRKNWLFALAMLGAVYYLFMAGERSGVISLIAALFVFMFVRHQYRFIVSLPVIATVGMLLLSVWMPTTYSQVQDKFLKDVRLDLWTHGLLIAEKDHFLGRGEHQSFSEQERNINTHLSIAGKQFLHRTYPPGLSDHEYEKIQLSYHNQFIQYLVEYGILALLFYVAFLTYPIVLAWRSESVDRIRLSGIMIWSAFAVHSLYETSFDNHSVIIIGLISGLTQLFQHTSSGDV